MMSSVQMNTWLERANLYQKSLTAMFKFGYIEQVSLHIHRPHGLREGSILVESILLSVILFVCPEEGGHYVTTHEPVHLGPTRTHTIPVQTC